MQDNIVFRKIWEDDAVMELKATCTSSVVSVTSAIYVSEDMLDELASKIKKFLSGDGDEELWENQERGDRCTACLSLRFLQKDKHGHITIEVFVELDDGGTYTEHNCCFFTHTEVGLLESFAEALIALKNGAAGFEIRLNNT